MSFYPTHIGLEGVQPLLRLGDGSVQFVLQAYTNRNYVIESADVVTNWTTLKSVFQIQEAQPVIDSSATNAPYRFYRARLAP